MMDPRRGRTTGGVGAGAGGVGGGCGAAGAAGPTDSEGRDAARARALARCERGVRADQLHRIGHQAGRAEGPGGHHERLGRSWAALARPRVAALRDHRRPGARRPGGALPAARGCGAAHPRVRPYEAVARPRPGCGDRGGDRQHGHRLLPGGPRPRLQPHGGAGGAARGVVEVPRADPLRDSERGSRRGHRGGVSAAAGSSSSAGRRGARSPPARCCAGRTTSIRASAASSATW